VLAWWAQLDEAHRDRLVEQLRALDMDQLGQLYARGEQTYSLPSEDKIKQIPVVRLGENESAAGRRGEEALRRGEVAVLLVAGGQGSRLGFDHPKGMYPIGPVSEKSLFQIHTEKVLALARRYGQAIPFLIMTSPATHAETEDYFQDHSYFGLPGEDVAFFRQGTMPALDIQSGRLLLAGPGELFTSPNGHGGTLTALAETGLLRRLREKGIRQVFYLQVDNPLVRMADPVFLGHHLAAAAEVSSKTVAKEGPTDKLGNFVLVDGRCSMIEYSDLPEKLARQTDEHGRLRIWAGSPAIHLFAVDFLERITENAEHIPFHVARKKVPYLDDQGKVVEPAKENAFKFERFIFDVLPLAERWTVVETSRRREFAPLKNATGPDSPPMVQQAISDLAAEWLDRAGVVLPRRPDGAVAVPLEISPLYALDAEELAGKVDKSIAVRGPLYLGEDKEDSGACYTR
jgi:UDP-N-acetylglucosamine/UDP-N-acetylgalactosamine diphosphorylase